jgi:hypothetical protein
LSGIPQGLGHEEASPLFSVQEGRQALYVVAFKNEKTGEYLSSISTSSTRQTSEAAAIQNGKAVDLKRYPLRETVKGADLSKDGLEVIIKELQCRGLLKTAVLAGTRQDRDFAEYLANFWANFEANS